MLLNLKSLLSVSRQALQLRKEREDHAPVILEIISILEGGPPVDVAATRSVYLIAFFLRTTFIV